MCHIQMNFTEDWQEEIIKEMKKEGLRFSDHIEKDSLIIKYFAYLRKKGIRQPYNVYKSKEFKCPPELQNGLNKLIKKLENGEDISPFLSKNVNKLIDDGMFNDWGILHLHLGEQMEFNNKYIQRTGPLLFVYFKGNNAYLINIYEHGSWTKKEVLQIIYNNWPELIEPFKIKGVSSLSSTLTEEQHKQLRDAGISAFVELKDEKGNKFPIMPPGMGIATSGDSIIDVRRYLREVKNINRLENLVKNSMGFIKDTMKKQNITIPKIFKFKLIYKKEKWIIKEENTGLIFEPETLFF